MATLTDGGQAEEAVEQLNNQLLMDTPVNVAVYPNECLLCIAHLPLNLDDTDFRSMASEYGAIERAFLMRSREGKGCFSNMSEHIEDMRANCEFYNHIQTW